MSCWGSVPSCVTAGAVDRRMGLEDACLLHGDDVVERGPEALDEVV